MIMFRYFLSRRHFILAFVFLCFIAEILVSSGLIPANLVPPPSYVMQALFENSSEFTKAFCETASAACAGYLISIFLGVSIALVFSMFNCLKKALLPLALFFQTVPIIAIAPLLVIYFGFGPVTVVVSALIVSIFPILAGTLIGLEAVEPGELELFKIWQASPWQILIKLRIPSAYLSFISSLKISAGLAVIGAVAGEFVAGGGLGSMIDSARTQQRIDLVFASLFLLSLLAIIMISILRALNHWIQSKRPFATAIDL